jgi:hypothetical protein
MVGARDAARPGEAFPERQRAQRRSCLGLRARRGRSRRSNASADGHPNGEHALTGLRPHATAVRERADRHADGADFRRGAGTRRGAGSGAAAGEGARTTGLTASVIAAPDAMALERPTTTTPSAASSLEAASAAVPIAPSPESKLSPPAVKPGPAKPPPTKPAPVAKPLATGSAAPPAPPAPPTPEKKKTIDLGI